MTFVMQLFEVTSSLHFVDVKKLRGSPIQLVKYFEHIYAAAKVAGLAEARSK